MEAGVQRIRVSDNEMRYRRRLFAGDTGNILNLDITCTVCGAKLNWMIFSKKQIMIHPLLEVVLCEGCLISHSHGEWPGVCVWCGVNRDHLLHCTKCPVSFCESCIRMNFGLFGVAKAKLDEEWECYFCDSEKLWTLRAVCDAAKNFTQELARIDKTNECSDCAICLERLENIKYLSCNHAFHKECLEIRIETSRSCPVCRSSYAANKNVN